MIRSDKTATTDGRGLSVRVNTETVPEEQHTKMMVAMTSPWTIFTLLFGLLCWTARESSAFAGMSTLPSLLFRKGSLQQIPSSEAALNPLFITPPALSTFDGGAALHPIEMLNHPSSIQSSISSSSSFLAASTLDPTTVLSDLLGGVLNTPLILAVPIVAALLIASLIAYLIVDYARPAEPDNEFSDTTGK